MWFVGFREKYKKEKLCTFYTLNLWNAWAIMFYKYSLLIYFLTCSWGKNLELLTNRMWNFCIISQVLCWRSSIFFHVTLLSKEVIIRRGNFFVSKGIFEFFGLAFDFMGVADQRVQLQIFSYLRLLMLSSMWAEKITVLNQMEPFCAVGFPF